MTDEGVDLAGADVEVDVVERLGAGEGLGEVADLEDQPVGVSRGSRAVTGRAGFLDHSGPTLR